MSGLAFLLCGACGLLSAAVAHAGDDLVWMPPARSLVAGHAYGVEAVACSADGKWIASGDKQGAIRLWEVKSGRVTAMLDGHTENVVAPAFTPDSKLLLSASWDKTVRVWKVPSGERLAVLADPASVLSLAVSEDGKLAA